MNQTTINAIIMGETGITWILISLVSLGIVALMHCSGKIFLKGIQQRGYMNSGYLEWISMSKSRFMLRLFFVSLFSLVAYITFCVVFAPFAVRLLPFLGLAFFFSFVIVFFKSNQFEKSPARQRIEYTSRLKRLRLTYSLLFFLLSLGVFHGMNLLQEATQWGFLYYARYFPICVFPILMPYVVVVANWINTPLEKMNIARYAKKAKEIIEKNQVKVVAVTGSFGKTTTKDIIASLLGEKYIVASAPKSYNTPSGVALTVNNYVTQQTEYVVLEMGARRVGDIAYLCKFVRPDYAVITSVGNQHMASFKNIENVAKTKNEIVVNAKKGAKAFFNCADSGARALYDAAGIEKYSSGENGCDLSYEITKVDQYGSQFNVNIDGEKHQFTTPLLGKNNVANACLAILVAYSLGVEVEVLQLAVAKLEPTEHRLQMMKKEHAIVIDDSYNANVKGARCAAEVLDMFEGRKILVTPGLVELGTMENESNRELGRVFGKVCDKVILVGTMRAGYIKSGLEEVGFDLENVITFENFEEAKHSLYAIMKKGDVVLFENDLPDSYL